MPNLTFASLRGTRTAIHCGTKSEAEQVEKICGFEKCAKAWLIYKKTYCISLSKDALICKGMFSEIDWYAKNDFAIIPAADFIAANSGEVEPPKSETPTAVEWFFDKIKSHFEHDGDLFESLTFTLAIAKQKEREQHGKTWDAAIQAHDDEQWDEPDPCPTCGDIDGMVNPCCAGYDPLHYKNCGYG